MDSNFQEIINILFENKKICITSNSKQISKNINNILNLVSNKNQNEAILKIDKLLDDYLYYSRKNNKEYYKAGFIDALNLIIPALLK